MDVKVEFSGLAREIVREKLIVLTLDDGASYSDVVERIAAMTIRTGSPFVS